MVRRSRQSALAAALLVFLVAAGTLNGRVSAFALSMGGSTAAAATSVARREGGGTRSPISAIAAPVSVKEIEAVGNVEDFERIVARPKQVSSTPLLLIRG